MKRSDFFKTLCALPLISLFVKAKATPRDHVRASQSKFMGVYSTMDMTGIPHAADNIHPDREAIKKYCAYGIGWKYDFWLLTNHIDAKENGIRCINCGMRGSELFPPPSIDML